MCDYCARAIKRFPDRYSNEIQKNENTTWRRFLFWVGTALVASSVKFAFPIVMCSSKLPIVVAYSVCYFFHGNGVVVADSGSSYPFERDWIYSERRPASLTRQKQSLVPVQRPGDARTLFAQEAAAFMLKA